MGKMIEAGLIVTELLARQMAARVLVIVPANLREQWQEARVCSKRFSAVFALRPHGLRRHAGRGGGDGAVPPLQAVEGSQPAEWLEGIDDLVPGSLDLLTVAVLFPA